MASSGSRCDRGRSQPCRSRARFARGCDQAAAKAFSRFIQRGRALSKAGPSTWVLMTYSSAPSWSARLIRVGSLKFDITTTGVFFVSSEARRSEEHTSELQSLAYLVCRLLLEKKKIR